MRIELVDRNDEPSLRAYWSVFAEVAAADTPVLPMPPFEELVAESPQDRSRLQLWWVGWEEHGPVGAIDMMLPTLDNTTLAELQVVVHPQHRRRGLGRALLETALQHLRSEGRLHAIGETAELLEGESAGAAFAAAVGATRANEDIFRAVELSDVTDSMLEGAEQQAQAHAYGYELVQWVGPCSDDVVDDLAVLTGRLRLDAPMGDTSWEAEVWDRQRVLDREQRALRLGRQWVTTAARYVESGHVVAYTDIGVSRYQPEIAHQWTTIVAPEHRGRRLGLLIKAANLALLRRELPQATRVITWNAGSNRHMIAINDALGFRPRLRLGQWQLDVKP
jgi:GNAT superfamily N-acetyltransferase